MLEILQKGGVLIVILCLASIISLTVFFERLWSLSLRRVAPPKFAAKILDLIKNGDYQAAILLSEENRTPLARILALAAKKAQEGALADLETHLEEKGRQEISAMSRDLETIGAVATISPLLGLLGTVFGMIKVFQRIEVMGVGDPTVLAGGIWEALITTAAGLVVAIPSFLCHKFLAVRVNKLALSIEGYMRQAIDLIKYNDKNNNAALK